MKNVNLTDEQILSLKAVCYAAGFSKQVKLGKVFKSVDGSENYIPFTDALCNVIDLIEAIESN